jgi:hypothetical protein
MRGTLLVLLAFSLLCGVVQATQLAYPSYPVFAFLDKDQGTVKLMITFGADGKAIKCVITEYSTSRRLAMATANFILKKWKAPELAGKSLPVPITYVLPAH